MEQLEYHGRLGRLNRLSVQGRLLGHVSIQTYKTVGGNSCKRVLSLFEFSSYFTTRCHPYKLKIMRSRTDAGKRFSSSGMAPVCNSLNVSKFNASTLESFERFLQQTPASVCKLTAMFCIFELCYKTLCRPTSNWFTYL